MVKKLPDDLPSVLTSNEFNEDGLVEADIIYVAGVGASPVKEHKIWVPAYVASPFGFHLGDKSPVKFLKDFYVELAEKAGVLALCPFAACAEYLDDKVFDETITVKEYKEIWEKFNDLVGPVNYETLMPHAKFMIAICDGGPDVDSGVAAEITHFAKNHGRVIAISSDFRPAENPAAPINPAVRYFVDRGPYKGYLCLGKGVYNDAYAEALDVIVAEANTYRFAKWESEE